MNCSYVIPFSLFYESNELMNKIRAANVQYVKLAFVTMHTWLCHINTIFLFASFHIMLVSFDSFVGNCRTLILWDAYRVTKIKKYGKRKLNEAHVNSMDKIKQNVMPNILRLTENSTKNREQRLEKQMLVQCQNINTQYYNVYCQVTNYDLRTKIEAPTERQRVDSKRLRAYERESAWDKNQEVPQRIIKIRRSLIWNSSSDHSEDLI